MLPVSSAEPLRAILKTGPLCDGRFRRQAKTSAAAAQKPQQEPAKENGRKLRIDPMRLKYNAACIFGTCASLLGTYIGAHVTEALTGSRMTAATGGSLIVSLIAGNGAFALAWSLIKAQERKSWKGIAGEVLDKVVKNLASSVPSVLSRIPVSAAAVLLGWSSEASGIAGFIMAQIIFYSTANSLYGVKLGRKNQQTKGNANTVLEDKASDIYQESPKRDIRG
jgi:hypothetical protein